MLNTIIEWIKENVVAIVLIAAFILAMCLR